MNAFIVGAETVSATHVWTQYHTADDILLLVRNMFYARDKCTENAHSSFRHTHKSSYQRLPNRTYVEMIATHRYSPVDITVSHTYSPQNMSCITLWILKRLFSIASNGLQKDHINTQNETRTFTHTQLATNEFQTETHSSLVCMCLHVQLLWEKPRKFLNETVLYLWKQFWDCSMPVVAHT